MDSELSAQRIRQFLESVGNRVQSPANLVLLGGSGLIMLGNQRSTLDLDYDGEEKAFDEFRRVLELVAQEMQIELEAVPLNRFIPLPPEAFSRHVPIGKFGNLRVFVFDPYSIALSKLDRGFDSDIEDVVFLLRQGFVELGILESVVEEATKKASDFDLNPRQMYAHLALAVSGLTKRS